MKVRPEVSIAFEFVFRLVIVKVLKVCPEVNGLESASRGKYCI